MILVFDTETTGLTLHPDAELRKQPRIIEFGGMLLDARGECVREVNVLINPQQPLTAEITKITGITDSDLKDAVGFGVAFDEEIAPMLAEATIIVAHNLPFDKAMLLNDAARHGRIVAWPGQEICTVSLYAPEWGRNPKLTELYAAKIGHPLEQTHRAIDDVRALVEVLRKERLPEMFL
jgi:DNA polymerase III epsilon subunit-like protein